jgi:DNA-binding response OmpR family regulator
MTKVLIVDDEPDLVRFVKRALESDGHRVLCAADGAVGLQMALAEQPDVVLLDLVMPGVDGQSMLNGLLAVGHRTRVIVVSATADIGARVDVLDSGADDFVAKPFSIRELLARVRHQAREGEHAGRSTAGSSEANSLVAGDLTLDLQTHALSLDGRTVSLSQREFLLMRHLMRRVGAVCTREELLSEVWGYSYDPSTNVVDVYIARLRRKLRSRSLIQTVRNVGYQIIAS